MTSLKIILKLIVCTVLMLMVTVSVQADPLEYFVDRLQSQLRVMVYRDGAMKWLGHNHVISHSNIQGKVIRDVLVIENSRFTLDLAVEKFVVDDVHARRISGSAFTASIDPEDAIATKKNMFRKEVLDVANFSHISIQGSIAHVAEQAIAQVQVTIKGVSKRYNFPINLRYSDERITARGDFSVKQSDFEIVPFSLMGGMLAVKDTLDISFVLVARR